MGKVLDLTIGIAIAIGAALGLLGAVPLLYMLYLANKAKRNHTKAPSIPVGFAAMVTSGLIITVEIYLAYLWVPTNFIEISVAAVLVMLVGVSVAGIGAWRSIVQEDAQPTKGDASLDKKGASK